jgi:hypothetical protein
LKTDLNLAVHQSLPKVWQMTLLLVKSTSKLNMKKIPEWPKNKSIIPSWLCHGRHSVNAFNNNSPNNITKETIMQRITFASKK